MAGVREALDRRRGRPGGRLAGAVRWVGAGLFVAVVLALVWSLLAGAEPAFARDGLRFLWGGSLDRTGTAYGAGPFVVGTLLTTAVALLLAVPVGIGTAAMLSELAPRWLAGPLSILVDLIAAVPSIVVGLFGLLVLSPLFGRDVGPFLKELPLLGRLFGGTLEGGSSVLLAGVILAVMILPTMVALTRTAFAGVARADREAALALGATRWQVVRGAVIPGARSGIRAAFTLSVGRAVGEAIAVALVIGNRPAVPHSLLAPGATLGSYVVTQFSEAAQGLPRARIVGLVVVLLVLTALVNGAGALLLRKRTTAGGTP